MAVTAFPVILVDSATGSDSAASGAGPSTALTGTGASTDTGTGATMIVTLDAGTDLTNVATDGSHVIYLADATAGHRNFAAINATSGSGGATPTVTVEQAFTVSLSGKSWAIGGKRASVVASTSGRLINNNSASGDAMPGWIIEMQSGHTETAGAITFYRSGNSTDGCIVLQGTNGAATRPVWTCNANNSAFISSPSTVTGWKFEGFKIQNSNGSKGSAYAFTLPNTPVFINNMILGDATNTIQGVCDRTGGNSGRVQLVNCQIVSTVGNPVRNNSFVSITLINCWFKNCGAGITWSGADSRYDIFIADGCLFTGGTGDAMTLTGYSCIIKNCTIDNNTGDGIDISGNSLLGAIIVNNEITRNGGYGINTTATANRCWLEASNNFGTGALANTSGDINLATKASSDLNVNPYYTNSGGNDWSVGTSVKGLGWLTTFIGANQSSTRSYVDIGAAQRQEGPNPGSIIIQPTSTY